MAIRLIWSVKTNFVKFGKISNNQLEDDNDWVRQVKQRYEPIYKKLVDYLPSLLMRYQQDKCGILRKMMRLKLLHWVNQLGFDRFNCSDGWVRDALKSNGLILLHLPYAPWPWALGQGARYKLRHISKIVMFKELIRVRYLYPQPPTPHHQPFTPMW